jgi:hypothetical protein
VEVGSGEILLRGGVRNFMSVKRMKELSIGAVNLMEGTSMCSD